MVHEFTPEFYSLHLFTPGKFDADFQFRFTFSIREPFLGASAVLFWALGMFLFIIFPGLSTCWPRGEASWGNSLCLHHCALYSGISSNAHGERASQAWGDQIPAAHPLDLGCRVPQCTPTHFEYQPWWAHITCVFLCLLLSPLLVNKDYLSIFSWNVLGYDREIIKVCSTPYVLY